MFVIVSEFVCCTLFSLFFNVANELASLCYVELAITIFPAFEASSFLSKVIKGPAKTFVYWLAYEETRFCSIRFCYCYINVTYFLGVVNVALLFIFWKSFEPKT